MSSIGQFLEPRETTLTRLTGNLPFDLQEQIGVDVARRRAGERIARFAQRQMKVPFIKAQDEIPQTLQDRMREARQEGGFFVGASFPGSNPNFSVRRRRLINPDGSETLGMRNIRRDISERGVMNRFGRRIL
jgi:hypothetical protein